MQNTSVEATSVKPVETGDLESSIEARQTKPAGQNPPEEARWTDFLWTDHVSQNPADMSSLQTFLTVNLLD